MTSILAAAPPAVTGVRRRIFGLALGAWRIALLLLAATLASQPVTMGLYLSGRFPMIDLHRTLGSTVALVALLSAALAVTYAVAGGRVWVAPVSVALFLATGFQIGMGYGRNLAVHLPLGVGVVAVSLVLAGWSWTRSAARYRVRGGGAQ